MKQKIELVRVSIIIALVIVLPVLSGLSGASMAASSYSNDRLLIVKSADAPAYQAVERSFRSELIRHTEELISIKSLSLDDDRKLETFLSRIDNSDYDSIITIGTRAAHEVLRVLPDVPVLSVFIPRQSYHFILDEVLHDKKAHLRSAVYLDQPDERLVMLAKAVSAPGAKVSLYGDHGGSILKTRQCSGGVASRETSGTILETAPDLAANLMTGVTVHQEMLSSRDLKHVLKRSDIIIATPQLVKKSPNAIKWMLYMAYQRNVPVIGYSRAFVDAGAIAAVYSTPEDIGRHTAEVFFKQRQPGSRKLSSIVYPKYFDVLINQNVANTLGFRRLNEKELYKMLIKSALNCKDNYIPAPSNKIKQQVTRTYTK